VNGQQISFVTPGGIYVAQEKYPVKQMSSATCGLPTDYDLGYDPQIPLAERLSNSGIFAHSALWTVADQGVRNVSHGCINMPLCRPMVLRHLQLRRHRPGHRHQHPTRS
jgi:lipoprotein-anchoring transpeptidase ErfK/SrfK